MRIHSMTATFGKLEHETLRLEPGLNILERPNEWGKSTWCAFLAAMLYGVETRAHTTKTVIADKERYAPWSGSPMSGSIELNWQGRDITVQRRTKGRIPMGEFSAFETKTGLPVPELTAQNCGQMLLGVEKAVFLRSAFLRGSDLAVEQEESLRRRLNALLTTADESATADDLARKLKELKNRCRANRTTGLLPQAYQRRAELEQDLQKIQSLQRQSSAMEQQIGKLENQRAQLELHRQTLDYRAAENAKQRYIHAAAELEEAAAREQECRRAVSGLQAEELLEARLQEHTYAQQNAARLRELLEDSTPASVGAESLEDASRDYWRYRRMRQGRLAAVIAAITALVAGAGLWILELPAYACAAWAVGCLGLIAAAALWLRIRKLSAQYRGLPADSWTEQAALRQQNAKLRAAYQNALAESQRITGGASPEAYLQKLRSGLDAYARLKEAAARREAAQRLAAALKNDAPSAQPPLGKDTLTCSRQETVEELGRCEEQLRQLQLSLGTCRGQMSALGQPSGLRQELEKLRDRIARLEDTYAALEMALNTLAEARADLQRRFAPQIVKKTQLLFSDLTGGRYGQLAMEEDLRLHIRAEGEDTLRPSLWRSEGTVDQLYLALRLAVASELVPDAPVILDDALVRFDDMRLKLAMKLLRQEAEHRQILLFTCQSREAAALYEEEQNEE